MMNVINNAKYMLSKRKKTLLALLQKKIKAIQFNLVYIAKSRWQRAKYI